MKREDVVYFGAGPAALPTDVLATAADALRNYQNTGLGVAEHSHRSQLATDIVDNMKKDLVDFLDVPESHDVLIMQGGGSGEFDATVYNALAIWLGKQRQAVLQSTPNASDDEVVAQLQKKAKDFRLDYLVTGSWSQKASQEALRLLGKDHVNVALDARKSSPNGKFTTIPAESTWQLSSDPAMVYLCENETVDGVEWPQFPQCLEGRAADDKTIVVGDFSSTILSRPIPFNHFSIVFFGAQKNLGLPGITPVIIKKSLLAALGQSTPDLARGAGFPVTPTILDYAVMAKNNSLYNTLSIFDVFVAGQVLKKLLTSFPDKVRGQEAVANRKANALYAALDAHSDAYKVVPDKNVRSRMNICFRVTKGGDVEEAEKAFLKGASERGLLGLKGHRSVGGIRASNYNAVPESGVEKLVAYLKEFATA